MNNNKTWSWAEYDKVRTKYPLMGVAVKHDLPNRESKHVQSKAQRMNTAYNVKFSQQELDYASKYGDALGTALMFLCPSRSPIEIQSLLKQVQ